MINLLILLLIFSIIIAIVYFIYNLVIISNNITILQNKLLLIELDLILLDKKQLNSNDKIIYTTLIYILKNLIDNLSNVNLFGLYVISRNKNIVDRISVCYKISSEIENNQLRRSFTKSKKIIIDALENDIKEWAIWLFPLVLTGVSLIILYGLFFIYHLNT
ncbi:hypothetical protein A6A19_07885 [Actinobacillus delphinicola]|uniref:hypothetical protein n=1 Tax=Actinobacillus delphinicola TaxID=51161 RepID=UPI00244190AF|nr:hypothetical protein [Actinobacillus delphinicola]MDG6897893.1 hypothetical protein [Actinobacillus delphinicola]